MTVTPVNETASKLTRVTTDLERVRARVRFIIDRYRPYQRSDMDANYAIQDLLNALEKVLQ